MSKTWLCGITNGSVESLKRLVNSCDFYDGLVWAVDSLADKSVVEYLDAAKKDGQIFVHPFRQAHDWQANEYLHSGVIQSGDLVCIMDSSDVFSKPMKDEIAYWDENGINTVFLDRPWFFRFTGHQSFEKTPHWHVTGIIGNYLNLSAQQGYVKEKYLLNTRNRDVSAVEHPIKYFIEYKRSNQCELLYYQFSPEIYLQHEKNRIAFQIYVEWELQIPCTVKSLINFISEGIKNKNLPDPVINFIQQEVNMKDLVRYHILKQTTDELASNRFDWNFLKFYYEGIEHQNKNEGYIGLFNQYKIQKGEKPE